MFFVFEIIPFEPVGVISPLYYENTMRSAVNVLRSSLLILDLTKGDVFGLNFSYINGKMR